MDDVDATLEARARAGKAIRDIGHAFVGRQATVEQIERLADALEAISADLWPADPRSRAHVPFHERMADEYPQGRFESRFDDRPVSGRSSPWGLDLELHRHGDQIDARVTLRAAHEGAPGRSHGGVVAALFDDVFGYALDVAKQAAFTGELTVRYHAPTPLHRELSCRVWLDQHVGRKLWIVGELTDIESGRLLATSTGLFISVDADAFARASAARPAPPDEDAPGA